MWKDNNYRFYSIDTDHLLDTPSIGERSRKKLKEKQNRQTVTEKCARNDTVSMECMNGISFLGGFFSSRFDIYIVGCFVAFASTSLIIDILM